MKILTPPPFTKIWFLGKKGGEIPKISKNFNLVWLISNFQGRPGQINEQEWGWQFWPPLNHNLIFRQKGGELPKLGKISTKFNWAQIFREGQVKEMNKIGEENLEPLPLAKILFLGKKGGGQNQQKIQPCPIELKFSGIARSNKWTRLGMKILTLPKP